MDSDAVFGVRKPMVWHYRPQTSSKPSGSGSPDGLQMQFELRLAQEKQTTTGDMHATPQTV